MPFIFTNHKHLRAGYSSAGAALRAASVVPFSSSPVVYFYSALGSRELPLHILGFDPSGHYFRLER